MPDVCIYVDDDDPESAAVAKEVGIKCVQGPQHTLSQCYNEAGAMAAGTILMFAGDDYIFREKDWDLKVIAAFERYPDRIAFVHGYDGNVGPLFGTCGFIHRKWINAVGYFVPPYFTSWCIDGWINYIAEALGRRVYLDFLLAEHMHYCLGKSEMDATYAQGEPLHGINMQKLFHDPHYVALKNADVEKLRRLLR
jgi:hypothetical protein